MIKISIITTHRANNYGALLQAYATECFLEEKGYEVEFIDYLPEYMRNCGTFHHAYIQSDMRKRTKFKRVLYSLIKTSSYKLVNKRFNLFVNEKLKLSRYFNDYKDLKDNYPISDIYCTGSDQVWNDFFGSKFEDAYFLNFLSKDEKCFSFASSFGKNDFKDNDKFYLSNCLKKYDFLTVREMDGFKLLKSMNFENVSLLVDPTILMNYSFWNNLTLKSNPKKKYILVYQLHGDSDALKQALAFAKKEKMKVVKINTMLYHFNFKCKNILLPTIEQFISLFKYATYVFTDSFHGTIFSLIFSKKFKIILPLKFENRILSLLSLIDANKFSISNIDEWNNSIDEKYISKVNYRFKILSDQNRKKIEEVLLKYYG